jgi:hemoglobin
VSDEPVPTIYQWAGGEAAFERWLNVFYDLVEEDAELAALFGGQVGEEHRRNGGLGITADMRLRFVTLLSRAADLAALPDDPEFRAALMGYAEWGTRIALHNSQPGAEVVEHAPVPRWGWGVAPPYRP